MKFEHTPVLLDEVIEGLGLKSGAVVVDATVGGGGHSEAMLEKIGDTGALVALDQDEVAIAAAGERFSKLETKAKISVWHMNFSDIADVLSGRKVDAILADLGVSSHQIDTDQRGFSYMRDAKLDMRMNQNGKLTAWDVVNKYKQGELARIIREYGEEGFSNQIAENIIKARPINTTLDLAKVCEASVFGKYWKLYGHPAKKTFQAIRIEVNGELRILEKFILDATKFLNPGGRIGIISFHSLEDRIVKNTFRELEKKCICPKLVQICTCGHEPEIRVITKKPIVAGDAEVFANPRSASAKLRIAEKL